MKGISRAGKYSSGSMRGEPIAAVNNGLQTMISALRQDPDVILVGEMRDQETISLALTAAETGHLVFGTLHTSSAAKTIDRIIDLFPAGEKPMVRSMLSESLEGVVAQRLIKKPEGGVARHLRSWWVRLRFVT